jgi:DNA transformation protein
VGKSTVDFLGFVMEQLAPLPLTAKPFFGGTALCAGGVQFAMVMEQALYFVVDDGTRPAFEALGSRCFGYQTKKGWVEVRKYFEVPAEFLEDRDRLQHGAQEALDAAMRAQSGKPKPPRKAKS